MKTQDVWEKVRRQGKRFHGSNFTLYYLRLAAPLKPRVVVSSKIDKRATVRNKIRRRIRNILKDLAPAYAGLLVITKPNIADASFQSLEKDFKEAINKLV